MKRIDTIHGENIVPGEMKSSIRQFEHTLNQFERSEHRPIIFDDVECANKKDGVVARASILYTDPNYVDHIYDICEKEKCTYGYVTEDIHELQVKKLDPRFGEGFYEDYVDEKRGVNADNGGVATVSKRVLRIGTPYFQTDNITAGENL